MNLYLISGNPSLCMFVVAAPNKWRAFDLYKNLKLEGGNGELVHHFQTLERERMEIQASSVIPIGRAMDYVPEGVIATMEDFLDSLPDMFVAEGEPSSSQEKIN